MPEGVLLLIVALSLPAIFFRDPGATPGWSEGLARCDPDPDLIPGPTEGSADYEVDTWAIPAYRPLRPPPAPTDDRTSEPFVRIPIRALRRLPPRFRDDYLFAPPQIGDFPCCGTVDEMRAALGLPPLADVARGGPPVALPPADPDGIDTIAM